MAFLAAGPFILFTFLMSPYTPIKSIRGKTSSAGHSMGLMYYSITWTIMAYLFFDNLIIIALGIIAMSYGDGLASVFGLKFGKQKYNIFGDEKSYIGSIAMFLFTFLMMIIVILIYATIFSYDLIITGDILIILALISIIASITEGVTPRGLDNLTVPFIVAFSYWFFIVM
jgi:dolichol kinase